MQSTQQSKLKQKGANIPQAPFPRSWRPLHYEKVYEACRAIPIVQESDERNSSPSLSAKKRVSAASALPKWFRAKETSPKNPDMSSAKLSKGLPTQSLGVVERPRTPAERQLPKKQKENSPLTPPSTPESIRRVASPTPSRLVKSSTPSSHSKKPCLTAPKRSTNVPKNNTSTKSQQAESSSKPSKSVRVVTPDDMVHAYLTILRERVPLHYLVSMTDENKRIMDLSPDRFAELLKQACAKAKMAMVMMLGEDSWAGWAEGRCCQ